MPRISSLSTALALCLWGGSALAAPAGTVLFSQPGSQIVDAGGTPRPAQRGDVLQHGERLLTPAGGISQVLLPDGSILGVRPGSELRFDPPSGAAPTVVALLQGSVRAIAAELMDSKRPSAMTLMSGQATLQLKGADVETTVVGDKQRNAVDPGSYSRLLTGTASIGKGSLVEPLSPRQVSFVGPSTVAPVTLSAVSPDLFGSRLPSPSLSDGSKTGTSIGVSSPTVAPPPDGSKTLLAPAPTLTLPTSGLTVSAPKTTLILAPLPPPPPKPVTIITPPTITVDPPKLPVVSCRILKTC